MDEQIEFDQNGWTVAVRSNQRMQISGRLPLNTQLALFDIVAIVEPAEPGQPTVAINSHGDRLTLVRAG